MAEARWYVVHTYSGYENKVKANIEMTVKNRKLEEQILEVSVPVQEAIEITNGKEKKIQRKLFPGYVLLNMVMNDDTWYVVRNTRGVTGFVGPGSKPVPLEEHEMQNWGLEPTQIEVGFREGDIVTVISGACANMQGTVKAINMAKQTVTINIDMFGRETPIEISFTEVRVN